MSIRNRVVTVTTAAFVQSQTNLIVGAFRCPAKARVKAVRATAASVAGGTPTVQVFQSATSTVNDTGANSTTLVHDAVVSLAASDTVYTDAMTGQFFVEQGVWLYFKYTTAGGVTATFITIQVELDY